MEEKGEKKTEKKIGGMVCFRQRFLFLLVSLSLYFSLYFLFISFVAIFLSRTSHTHTYVRFRAEL